jgi:hypothetical protein
VGAATAAASVSAPASPTTVDAGLGANASAGANGTAQAEALARRWPIDWFTRYDRPVARVIPRSNGAPAQWAITPWPERAIVAAGTEAEVYPVRWPQLVGQPLPPITSPTSVMGASASSPRQ